MPTNSSSRPPKLEVDHITENSDLPSLKSLLQLKKKYEAPAAEDLPPGYRHNSHKEELFLWAAHNFGRQIRHKHPTLDPMFLVSANECNTKKLIMTFIKPTVLPYSHLFDISACAKFVSDFIFYQPEKLEKPKINSPTSTLATQTGNSVEISNLLVSLLNGFGFQSFVVLGVVDHLTAKMNLTHDRANLAESPKERVAQETNEDKNGIYAVVEPPELESNYLRFLENLDKSPSNEDDGNKSSLLTVTSSKSGSNRFSNESKTGSETERSTEDKEDRLHGWVYVQLQEKSFFIEATTGEKKMLDNASYKKIIAIWNQENYWLNNSDTDWKTTRTIDLNSNEKWVKFVADLELVKGHANKRLLSTLNPWLNELSVPQTSYELVYKHGQKVETFKRVKVEYFAPYLLKDGMVQRVQQFKQPIRDVSEDDSNPGQNPVHVLEKFRHRTDKMRTRETFPETEQVVERFDAGRGDQLLEHDFFKLTSAHVTEHSLQFYHEARPDGLLRRVFRDMEVTEHYEGRSDGLVSMKAVFGLAEKKFGPADNTKGNKEISKIVESYATEMSLDEEEETVNRINPGRILDTSKIMEKTYDVENERIVLKFQREGGQIFYKAVEFNKSTNPEEDDKLSLDDCKVFMVDPREERPTLKELALIYEDQLKEQEVSVQRVVKVEHEMEDLLETRMRELSANDMEVWIYDTKRNIQVKKGRTEEEKLAKIKEESVVDLKLDFLAPYLERYQDIDSMSKMQAIEVRDECLNSIKLGLEEKELELEEQIKNLKAELKEKAIILPTEDVNTKRFYLNVLESRLSRQKRHNIEYFVKAEEQVANDPRILQCFS